MKKIVWLAGVFAVMASLCRAEPRWCSVTGRRPEDKFVYPPIARAARVQGVVLTRMVYTPSGKVVRFEPVSGPRLLSDSLAGQLMNWTVKTDASGDELCETLIIAKFGLRASDDVVFTETPEKTPPSVLRLSVEVDSLPIEESNIDPAPLRGFKLFRAQVKWKLNRALSWLLGTHQSSS